MACTQSLPQPKRKYLGYFVIYLFIFCSFCFILIKLVFPVFLPMHCIEHNCFFLPFLLLCAHPQKFGMTFDTVTMWSTDYLQREMLYVKETEVEQQLEMTAHSSWPRYSCHLLEHILHPRLLLDCLIKNGNRVTVSITYSFHAATLLKHV